MSHVPAASRALRVLRFLATQADPVPLERIMSACDLPRSSAYHLMRAMADEHFVVHLADEGRYGLGAAAFEVGSGYVRHAPLERLARRPLARLVARIGHTAHLAVLHGRDVLYLVEDRARGRPPLVTDVGVRLPAHLTASGRAILAGMPASQVRALYPDVSSFDLRTPYGPRSPSALRRILEVVCRQGYSIEQGEVSLGMASVAAAIWDHNGHPVAAVAMTYPQDDAQTGLIAAQVVEAALALSRRLGGGPAPAPP